MKKYVLPELGYDYSALEPHYSARMLEFHHGKHHAAYVDGRTPRSRNSPPRAQPASTMPQPVAEEPRLPRLGPRAPLAALAQPQSPRRRTAEGELLAAIDECFGTFEAMREQMTEAAANVQGSGWGALAWEPVGQRLVVEQVHDHQGNIGNGTIPILVVDMWEHAYYCSTRT